MTKTIQTAANKPMTKVERERRNVERANASAAKAISDDTFDPLKTTRDYITSHDRSQGLARVLGAHMNNMFAAPMADLRIHWSDILASKNAKAEGSNLRPIWERIEHERKAFLALYAEAKPNASESAARVAWKGIRDAAVALYRGTGEKRERVTRTAGEVARDDLIHAYKALGKETCPTDADLETQRAIGEVLARVYRVDLSTLNV